MPVAVHIPVRVRIDRDALAARADEAEEAVRAAVARALGKSRREAVEPRAAYMGVRLAEPDFLWSGETVPRDEREVFEAKLRRALAEAVQASEVLALARRNAKARPPLQAFPAEFFDPARGSDLLGFYTLPSYRGKGKPATVNVKAGNKKPDQTETMPVGVWVTKLPRNWYQILSRNQIEEFQRKAFDLWSMIYPEDSPAAVIWYQGGEKPWGVVINKLWIYIPLYHFESRVATDNAFKTIQTAPVPGPGYLEWVSIDAIKQLMATDADEKLRKKNPKPEATDTAVYEEKLKEAVQAEVAHRLRAAPNCSDVLVVWVAGSQYFLADTDHTYPRFPGRIPLAPVARIEQIPVPEEEKEEKKEEEGAEPLLEGAERGAGKGAGKGGGKGDGKGDGKGEGKDAGTGAKGAGAGDGAGKAGADGSFASFGDDLPPGTNARKFPPGLRGGGAPIVCESFVGEPSLDLLSAADAEPIRALIREIAYKLDIEICEYPANFCLDAAAMLGTRAIAVSDNGVLENNSLLILPPKYRAGGEGSYDFRPTVSPALQLIRHLARVTHRIGDLGQLIYDTYKRDNNSQLFEGFRRGNPIGWSIDFFAKLNTRIQRSVGQMFVVTTRILLAQMLETSRQGIESRIGNAGYARFFASLIKAEMVKVDELETLRSTLRLYVTTQTGSISLGQVVDTWRSARGALLDTLSGRNPFANAPTVTGTPFTENGVHGIRDSLGQIWTAEQLDRAIAIRRDVVSDIDPVAHQIAVDERLRARFARDTSRIAEELAILLDEMKHNNAEIMQKVRDDLAFAFELCTLDDEHDETIAGTGYALTGLHRLAHESLEEFFAGDFAYNLGVGAALDRLRTWRTVKTVFEVTLVVGLSIVCPPLGTAVGFGFAIYHEYEGQQKLEVYQSLLDPEVVLTRAEVEAELFANDLGLVLSFIPVAGQLKKFGLGRAAGKLLQGEVRAAAQMLSTRVSRVLLVETLRALQKDLIVAFVRDVVIMKVFEKLMDRMVSPIIGQIEHDLASIDQLEAFASEVKR
jgi:hypothetical protein